MAKLNINPLVDNLPCGSVLLTDIREAAVLLQGVQPVQDRPTSHAYHGVREDQLRTVQACQVDCFLLVCDFYCWRHIFYD